MLLLAPARTAGSGRRPPAGWSAGTAAGAVVQQRARMAPSQWRRRSGADGETAPSVQATVQATTDGGGSGPCGAGGSGRVREGRGRRGVGAADVRRSRLRFCGLVAAAAMLTLPIVDRLQPANLSSSCIAASHITGVRGLNRTSTRSQGDGLARQSTQKGHSLTKGCDSLKVMMATREIHNSVLYSTSGNQPSSRHERLRA